MDDAPVLTYHKVDDAFEWGLTRVSPRTFRTQISFLIDSGYRLVTLSQLAEVPHGRRLAAITFDDAYRCIYRYAFPILKELGGLPATLFVIADYVGRKNTWDVNVGGIEFEHSTWEELAEMSDAGLEIGSHTLTHRDLTRLPQDTCRRELVESKEILQGRLGAEVRYVAYPFGKFDNRAIDLSRDAGYAGACIFHPFFKYRFNKRRDYLIRRYGVYSTDVLPLFKAKLERSLLTPVEFIKQNILSICANATIFTKSWSAEEKKLDIKEFVSYNIK